MILFIIIDIIFNTYIIHIYNVKDLHEIERHGTSAFQRENFVHISTFIFVKQNKI